MTKSRTVARKKTSARVVRPKTGRGIKQLVITLSTSKGEIAKIEELGAAGKRRNISEAELAKLAGDADLDDFSEALETAYAAGIRDGLDETIEDDLLSESATSTRRGGAKRTAGEQMLRAGVRRTIVRRMLQRGAVRRAAAARNNGAHDAR